MLAACYLVIASRSLERKGFQSRLSNLSLNQSMVHRREELTYGRNQEGMIQGMNQ